MSRDHQFEIVHASLEWLSANQHDQPNLLALAQKTGYSPTYIQKVFLDWAGLSPKQFLQLLTRDVAVKRLIEGASNLEASIAAGLSGTGRLHDLLITTDALTPGEIRHRAKGVAIDYGFGNSPFGSVLVARYFEKDKRAVFPYLLTQNVARIKRKLKDNGWKHKKSK